jgi:hypothetical protein
MNGPTVFFRANPGWSWVDDLLLCFFVGFWSNWGVLWLFWGQA